MTQNEYNALMEASKKNDAFLIARNKKYWVCQNIGKLPYFDDTLENYLTKKENAYKLKISVLEARIEKLEKINAELIEAIKTLNK